MAVSLSPCVFPLYTVPAGFSHRQMRGRPGKYTQSSQPWSSLSQGRGVMLCPPSWFSARLCGGGLDPKHVSSVIARLSYAPMTTDGLLIPLLHLQVPVFAVQIS